MISMPKLNKKLSCQPTDGATLFSETIASQLKSAGLNIVPHSFEKLLLEGKKSYLEEVFSGEYVFSSVGPYAYLYAYFREKYNLNIPIIRDIHGAIWSGYLMQEWLFHPFEGESDVIIFPSEFCRSLYLSLFPYLRASRSFVWHPMFLENSLDRWKPKKRERKKAIGYIGRLSRDKNVDDVVRAAAYYRERYDKNIEIHILGGFYDLSIEDLKAIWNDFGGRNENFVYWGYNSTDREVTNFYNTIDVLLFLSTSNAEALGRVVIEASNYSIPVCMADHAAAAELLPGENLVLVDYFNHKFECHDGVRMGDVSCRATAKVLSKVISEKSPHVMKIDRFDTRNFARFLTDLNTNEVKSYAQSYSCEYRQRNKVTNLEPLNMADARRTISELLSHLKTWMSENSRLDGDLFSKLLSVSSNKNRTRRFIENVVDKKVNYADLSAFPFHLSQIANFHPVCTARLFQE